MSVESINGELTQSVTRLSPILENHAVSLKNFPCPSSRWGTTLSQTITFKIINQYNMNPLVLPSFSKKFVNDGKVLVLIFWIIEQMKIKLVCQSAHRYWNFISS